MRQENSDLHSCGKTDTFLLFHITNQTPTLFYMPMLPRSVFHMPDIEVPTIRKDYLLLRDFGIVRKTGAWSVRIC